MIILACFFFSHQSSANALLAKSEKDSNAVTKPANHLFLLPNNEKKKY